MWRIKLLVAAVLVTVVPASGEANRDVALETAVVEAVRASMPGVVRIDIDPISGRVARLQGHLADGVDWGDDAAVCRFVTGHGSALGFSGPHHTYTIVRRQTDARGYTHVRLQHRWRGVRVFGSEVVLHADPQGVLRSINGPFVGSIDVDVVPSISTERAFDVARSDIGPAVYRWDVPREEALLKRIHRDPARTWKPTPALVIAPVDGNFQGDDYRLAWEIRIAVEAPAPATWHYFVDARTGDVIARWNDESGATGVGLYSGTVNFETWFNAVSALYEMNDTERNITTYAARNTPVRGRIMTDPDDTWDDISQDVGVDAHWGATQVYEYWLQIFGRDGLNGSGSPEMSSTVHWGEGALAGWNGTYAHFGDGIPGMLRPCTPLDVVAHEFGHGLVDYTSNLVNVGESGALTEGFADIIGVSVDFFSGLGSANWEVLEQVVVDPENHPTLYRRLHNPKGGQAPDTYLGQYWDPPGTAKQGLVAGHQFYLLSTGLGDGENDNDDTFDVTGIGTDEAALIWYTANTTYFTTTTTFFDARHGTESAAIDLYGYASTEHIQTLNAWYAVGVLEEPAVIRGTVLRPNGTGLPWVTMTVDDGVEPFDVFTGPDGSFSVVLDAGWTGTITPSKPDFTFTFDATGEDHAEYTTPIGGVQYDEIAGQDFTAIPPGPPPCAKCPDPHQETPGQTPTFTGLVAIAPNPFTLTTEIQFALRDGATPVISIYNVRGQRVRRVDLGTQPVGFGQWVWSGTDQMGHALSSGVYFVVLEAGEVIDYRKAVLLRQ